MGRTRAIRLDNLSRRVWRHLMLTKPPRPALMLAPSGATQNAASGSRPFRQRTRSAVELLIYQRFRSKTAHCS